MIQTIETPWGKEIIWAHTDVYVGKILHVNAGHALSVQYHRYKDESMYVLSGEGYLHLYTMDEDGDVCLRESLDFTPETTYGIIPGEIHSLEAITDLIVLEVSTNHLTDLVRLNDRYNRR
jgi:mannose-6-phosphate isomerase-like protein (cupin superfamily)